MASTSKPYSNHCGDRKTLLLRLPLLALFGVAASTNPSMAQDSKHSCTIIVGNPGLLRQNADTSRLSSTFAGGRAAQAQLIATNSRYRASVDTPTGFSVFPNGGSFNTHFKASFSSSGASNFFSTAHSIEQKVKKGVSNVEVHLTASRFDGSFPAGNYAANVTLRCE